MSDERYEIIQLLGKGRTGGIYEAEDHVLQRKVAIRRFFSQTGASDTNNYQEEFESIAHSLGAIQHPNLLTVYDAGMDSDGPFLIAQLLSGSSLPEYITQSGYLQPYEAHDFAHQMLDALSAAHAGGFYHGAIGPGSVMLVPRGRGGFRYIILDLGLSRLAPLIQGQDSALAMMADPATVPPELYAGHPASAKSDLYMLGHIIYYSLIGGHPFGGLTLEEASTLHQTGIPHLSAVNPEFQGPFYDWIASLTHPDPAMRPESAVAAMQSQPPAPVTAPPQPSFLTTPVTQTAAAHSLTQTAAYSTSTFGQPSSPQPLESNSGGTSKKFIVIGAITLLVSIVGLYLGLSKGDEPTTKDIVSNENQPSKAQQDSPKTEQPKISKTFKNVITYKFTKPDYTSGILKNVAQANTSPVTRVQYRDDFIAFNHGQHFVAPTEKVQQTINPHSIAVSAMVHLDEISPNTPILSYYDDTQTPGHGFHISVENLNYVIVITAGRKIYKIEGPAAAVNTWAQVGFTYSSGNLQMFVNGERIGQTSTTLSGLKLPEEADLLFGARNVNGTTLTMSGIIHYAQLSPNASREQMTSWWQKAEENGHLKIPVTNAPAPLPAIPSIDIGPLIEDS